MHHARRWVAVQGIMMLLPSIGMAEAAASGPQMHGGRARPASSTAMALLTPLQRLRSWW